MPVQPAAKAAKISHPKPPKKQGAAQKNKQQQAQNRQQQPQPTQQPQQPPKPPQQGQQQQQFQQQQLQQALFQHQLPHLQRPNPNLTKEDWDEKKLGQAIRQLTEVQSQLSDLRPGIPRMMWPLSRKDTSPKDMFSQFSEAVTKTTDGVNSLKAALTSPETKAIFAHVEQSKAQAAGNMKL